MEFVSVLARKILEGMDAVIVTGGYRSAIEGGKREKKKASGLSTDTAALNGARSYASDQGRDLKDCFEAWVPDPRMDRADGVVRMTAGDGIKVVEMRDRTALGRRLAMVAGVDMVVTISGRKHTEVVLEQALELGRPVLPIPNAGGDSEDLLDQYKERIAANFETGALKKCLDRVTETINSQPEVAAQAVVGLLKTARVGKCLVLSPFDEVHNALYSSVVERAVARHMVPLRLDHHPRSDAIYNSFMEAIRSSSAVIIDVTVLNQNVMYEIGYAHGYGSGLPLLIYAREQARLDDLPLYLRTLNVRLAAKPVEPAIEALIDGFLDSVKHRRP